MLFCRDEKRVRAIQIYDQLKPGISRLEAGQILTAAGVSAPENAKSLLAIERRFKLLLFFDENDKLCLKQLFEENYPNHFERILQRVGLPVGEVMLRWP
jgi:hypothetical protein